MLKNDGEKILILTGRFGEGHQQVANAIQEAVIGEFPNVEAKIIDFMAWAYPNLYPISHFVYTRGIKRFPQVYGFLYKKTYDQNYFSRKLNAIFSMGIRKMLKLIESEKPTVVVSTYPFASSVFSKLKEYGLTNIPLVTVITDHTYHSYWIHPCTDQYIVDSGETRERLIRLGIPAVKVACTGIPIRQRFLKKSNRGYLVRKYQLKGDLPTILVMGGGDGIIGKDFLNEEILQAIPKCLQLIILCGHNEKLQQHLQTDLIHSKHHIKILGYTESVDELMSVSDIIVTKAGGVTTSEALAMELPMLLYKPLPGQEQDNAKYLIHEGVAVQADHPYELILQLNTMLENKRLLAGMKKKARNIQSKNAAFFSLGIINQALANHLFTKEAVHTKYTSLNHITDSILVNHGDW